MSLHVIEHESRNAVWRAAKAWLRSGEPVVTLILAAAVFVLITRSSLFTGQKLLFEHLGGEYYNIAVAVAEGRGYSDPFGALSGPTAWMPPALTYLLAGCVLVFQKKASVAHAVVVMTGISWVVVGVIVFRLARHWRTTVSPFLVVALYVGWLWVFYGWLFMDTHDVWLIALVVALVTATYSRYLRLGRLNPWSWGLLGGFSALTSPAVAFAWLGLSLYVLWRARPERRRVLGALAVSAALAAPWVVRNAVVFHRLIPTKSNAAYELYAANYQDEDGVYDDSVSTRHPYSSVMMRHEYVERGELGFVDEHRDMFFASLKREPKRYLRAVVNRLVAVTVKYVPFTADEETPAKVAVVRGAYPLPFLMLLVLLALRRRTPPVLTGLAIFYALYLLPYVVMAFYPRYFLPLTPILVAFVFFAIDRVVAVLLREPLHLVEARR